MSLAPASAMYVSRMTLRAKPEEELDRTLSFGTRPTLLDPPLKVKPKLWPAGPDPLGNARQHVQRHFKFCPAAFTLLLILLLFIYLFSNYSVEVEVEVQL